MTEYDRIQLDVSDGVATATLTHGRANALDHAMAEELNALVTRVASDPDIRALALTGSGDMFCAGGDLKSFTDAGDAVGAHITRIAGALHAAIARMAQMDAPVVMAVNGVAAGAGFSLALAGDVVIAAEEAKFVSAYTASGLCPDGGSTHYLARHIGLLRAKELL